MFEKKINVKNLLSEYLKNNKVPAGEYAKAASNALEKAGFRNIIILNSGEDNKQLVMINMNASIAAIESGLIFNENKDAIIGFKNSDDYKSVTTDTLARHLIMDSIDAENDILRLQSLSKTQRSWVIHYITNEIIQQAKKEDNKQKKVEEEKFFPDNLCNVHTHGLDAFAHKDFQVVLDIGKESIVYILNLLADRVRDGEVFSAGEKVKGVYADCEIKLAAAKEGNREVLRVLIPDDANRFPGEDDCSYPYSEQDRVIS